LGRLLLSRVPLPAAMMAMANSLETIDEYGLMAVCVVAFVALTEAIVEQRLLYITVDV